jgi:hypothetical protein
MRSKLTVAAVSIGLAASLLTTSLPAQEGFPLDGTWRGYHGPSAADRTVVVIVMKWDGNDIEGIINPGPNALPFTAASLEPSNWTVHIEAQTRDGAAIVIDALLEDVGSYNRTLTGTWAQAGVTETFELQRE